MVADSSIPDGTDQRLTIDVVGGPNGSGKTTVAERLFLGQGAMRSFINADTIARGLSGMADAGAELQASGLMLDRIRHLLSEGRSIAFETTLAARSYASVLRDCLAQGYLLNILYVWVYPVEVALSRIAARVRLGGHDVPEPTVRRRYGRSARNFFRLYQPLAHTWTIMDNSESGLLTLAFGGRMRESVVLHSESYERLRQIAAE